MVTLWYYTLWVKKLYPFLFEHNFRMQILSDFNNSFTVEELSAHKQVIAFATSPIVCYCTTLEECNHIHFFTVYRCANYANFHGSHWSHWISMEMGMYSPFRGDGKRAGMTEWEWKGMGIMLYLKILIHLVMFNISAMSCYLLSGLYS